MRPLTNIPLILTVAALLLLTAACGPTARQQALLNRADSLMNVNPAAALRLTDSLLADGQGGSHWQSQLRLRRLNAINKLDTIFTAAHVAQAKTLADHFDRQGTPNERMLAHYLLGRTYADTGEAPMALQSYFDAAECADTIAINCDYHTLCRVYSQMAELFYRQNLIENSLKCYDLSITYALRNEDTFASLNSYAHKMGCYDRLGIYDSVISIGRKVFESYIELGYPSVASQHGSQIIRGLIRKGQLRDAYKYIATYDKESGYFDSEGNIEKGRESYYNIKGEYFLASQKYDSAEYYFRKELCFGQDFNNQNMASKGLAKLYRQTDNPDSAAKYALYSYDMNDSVYAQMVTSDVERMTSLFNYSRHQREAQQERERADRERSKLNILLYIMISIAFVSFYIIYKYREKKKAEYEEHHKKIMELEQIQTDVMRLRSHESELNELLQEKEARMEQLKNEIASYQKYSLSHNDTEGKIIKSNIYQELLKAVDKGRILTDDEWHKLNLLVIETLPNFHQFLSNSQYKLSTKEYCTCILFRLHVHAKPTAHLLGVAPSYITKLSCQLLKKLFSCEGNSRDLSKKLLEFD